MTRGEQHQARILAIHLLCEEIPHAGALGLLQREAHPVHEHLLEILLRAHLVNFDAITRRHGGAERDVLLHKLRAHGRCYGCGGVQFFERRRFAVFFYAEIHKQHDVIQRRVACLPQNERIGLAGKLPVNGSDVIARHILAQIEHLAWVVALAVLHFAFGLRRTGRSLRKQQLYLHAARINDRTHRGKRCCLHVKEI